MYEAENVTFYILLLFLIFYIRYIYNIFSTRHTSKSPSWYNLNSIQVLGIKIILDEVEIPLQLFAVQYMIHVTVLRSSCVNNTNKLLATSRKTGFLSNDFQLRSSVSLPFYWRMAFFYSHRQMRLTVVPDKTKMSEMRLWQHTSLHFPSLEHIGYSI